MSSGQARIRLTAGALRQLAVRRARREAEAWDGRLRELARRVDAACHEYESQGMPARLEPPQAPPDDDLKALQDHIQTQRTLWEMTYRSLENALARARSQTVSDAIESFQVQGRAIRAQDVLRAFDRGREGNSSTTEECSDKETEIARRSELAQRLVSRLSPNVSEEAKASVLQLAMDVVGAPTQGRAEALAVQLRAEVDEKNKRADRLAADQREAVSLLLGLPSGGTAGAALADRLERVISGEEPLTDEMRWQVEMLRQQAKSQDEQAFVAAALREAAGEVAYQVEEGFETLVVERGRAFVRGPGWGDRAVRLRFHPDTGQLDFAMVAVSETGPAGRDPDEDARIEAEWCRGVPEFRECLLERGVELTLHGQEGAGTRLLSVVSPDVVRLPASSREELRLTGRKRGEPREGEKENEIVQARSRRPVVRGKEGGR